MTSSTTATLDKPLTTAARGECCMCPNDAVYYDSQGTGYCLGHWQGGQLRPGQECAQLMYRDSEIYWVKGTKILDLSTWSYALKPLRSLEFVHTVRTALGKQSQALKRHLLPIRPGMPKVHLWEFSEVFDTPDYSQAGDTLQVDQAQVAEDRAEIDELE